MNKYKISTEAEEAVSLGRENHWRFKVVGTRGTINEPLPKEGWWFYPATINTFIPQNAQKRIDVLERSGVKIQQVIIGHEASKLLSASPQPKPLLIKKVKKIKPKKDPVDVSIAADVLAIAFKLAFDVAVATVGVTVWLVGTALGTILLLDPTVIVVLEDGTWLECMTWYD